MIDTLRKPKAVILTYKHFQDVDFVDERSVVFDFLFLDSLNGKLLMALPVFG